MQIDILSDLHLDLYFSIKKEMDIDAIKAMYDPIFLKDNIGDVLVIAGDIGHHNQQNIEILKFLQKEYYKYIICVLGNHDYYLLGSQSKELYNRDSFSRAKEMRMMINNELNMYCLDGDIVEIDGVKFGGCDSSYSNAHLKEYFPLFNTQSIIQDMWKKGLNDERYMYNVSHYDTVYKQELPKIEAVYEKCDVMITHVNPSYLNEHISSKYIHDRFSTFFTFNGHKFLKNGNMKYWLFGHTHDYIEYEYYGVNCICNPFGYPLESSHGNKIKIKSIEI